MTFRFSVLSKLLDRQMAGIAAEFGLSLAAYRALATIAAFDETTAADLVRYTSYDKAALSRTVVELEKLELIEVRNDPSHGRRRILSVTPQGHDLLGKAAPRVEARRDGLSAQLTDEEERGGALCVHGLCSGGGSQDQRSCALPAGACELYSQSRA